MVCRNGIPVYIINLYSSTSNHIYLWFAYLHTTHRCTTCDFVLPSGRWATPPLTRFESLGPQMGTNLGADMLDLLETFDLGWRIGKGCSRWHSSKFDEWYEDPYIAGLRHHKPNQTYTYASLSAQASRLIWRTRSAVCAGAHRVHHWYAMRA